MDFIKKNIAFCLVVFVCVLAALAGGYLAFAESGKVKSAKNKTNSAEAQLSGLLAANPAPSVDNLQASEQNLADLTTQLQKIRDNLQKGSRINSSTDSVGVMAGIQQYISEYQSRIEALTNDEGGALIETPNNFAYGFEKYIEDSDPLTDEKAIADLDKQRQILSYILNKLIESEPSAITSIQRELVEEGEDESKAAFKIDEAISARVPGAINTMAFSVTFSGYTDSLRVFLNSLAKFDLPIVVRSVGITRPEASSAASSNKPQNLDALFGGAFGESPTTEVQPEVTQKPVVTDNVSSFTVVLEFIDIILPSDAEKNPS